MNPYRAGYTSVVRFLVKLMSSIGIVSVNQDHDPPDQTVTCAGHDVPRRRSQDGSMSPVLNPSWSRTASLVGSNRIDRRYGAHLSSAARFGYRAVVARFPSAYRV